MAGDCVEIDSVMAVIPLVSICCITYNHAPFIRKCMDGFLMQETSFPFEILIHDDASTDGTDSIIKNYEASFPDLIFPLYETENQYSKGFELSPSNMDIKFNYSRAKGKYIAYCEGDDYWSDPHKLQRQVDFLETHPEYSVCWHRCKHLHWEDNKWENDKCNELLNDAAGVDIDIATLFSGWYTQPLSMLFRKSMFDFSWNNRYKYFRDEHEFYHLLTVGKGYLLNFIGGVYVIHGGGVSGAIDHKKQCIISYKIAEELYRNNKNEYTKRFYADNLQWAVYQHKNECLKKIIYSFKLFLLAGNKRLLIKNLLR